MFKVRERRFRLLGDYDDQSKSRKKISSDRSGYKLVIKTRKEEQRPRENAERCQSFQLSNKMVFLLP